MHGRVRLLVKSNLQKSEGRHPPQECRPFTFLAQRVSFRRTKLTIVDLPSQVTLVTVYRLAARKRRLGQRRTETVNTSCAPVRKLNTTCDPRAPGIMSQFLRQRLPRLDFSGGGMS